MSNKIQLQINNTSLDSYIARINAAKDIVAGLPGAGGGASIETCTITFNYITNARMGINFIHYTKAGINGPELVSLQIEKYENYATTLEDVICNTMILVYIEEAFPVNELSSNIIEVSDMLGAGRVFMPVSGGSGTITINNNF
jgi:hypothetical protein